MQASASFIKYVLIKTAGSKQSPQMIYQRILFTLHFTAALGAGAAFAPPAGPIGRATAEAAADIGPAEPLATVHGARHYEGQTTSSENLISVTIRLHSHHTKLALIAL